MNNAAMIAKERRSIEAFERSQVADLGQGRVELARSLNCPELARLFELEALGPDHGMQAEIYASSHGMAIARQRTRFDAATDAATATELPPEVA
jgi:hypothetical protein